MLVMHSDACAHGVCHVVCDLAAAQAKLDKHDHTSKIRTHDLTLAYLTTIAVNPGEDAW